MNKKITLYELLGLIKDGKAPKEIKYNNYLLSFDDIDEDYYCEFYGNLFEYLFTNIKTTDLLNNEIEILDDEDKNSFTGWKMYQNGKEVASMDCSYDEAMEIKIINSLNNVGNSKELAEFKDKQQLNNHILKDKINELVREINKLKKYK